MTQSLNLYTADGTALTTLTSNYDTLTLPTSISLGNDGATAHHADSGNVGYDSLDALCDAYGLCIPEVLALGFPDRVLDGDTVLLLTQDAYLATDPRHGKPCYLASAVDADGKQYRMTWCIRDGFDGDDESDACDWANPIRIEKL